MMISLLSKHIEKGGKREQERERGGRRGEVLRPELSHDLSLAGDRIFLLFFCF